VTERKPTLLPPPETEYFFYFFFRGPGCVVLGIYLATAWECAILRSGLSSP
jgi:hypothetical protein